MLRTAAREAILIIEPPPFLIIFGIAAFIIRNGPVRLMSIIFCPAPTGFSTAMLDGTRKNVTITF
jgi:hypothetical protein